MVSELIISNQFLMWISESASYRSPKRNVRIGAFRAVNGPPRNMILIRGQNGAPPNQKKVSRDWASNELRLAAVLAVTRCANGGSETYRRI